MELDLRPFGKKPCTEEEARAWLEATFDAHVVVVPDFPGHDYPPHSHGCDEIIVGLEGRIEFYAEGGTYTLEPGWVLYLPEGTEHSAKVGAAGATYMIGQAAM